MYLILKRYISIVVSLVKITVGSLIYLVTGSTPPFAFHSLLNLFCKTRGRAVDVFSRLVSLRRKPYGFPNSFGVLGDLRLTDVRNIASDINRKGYHVFEKKLSAESCDNLFQFALNSQCWVRPLYQDSGKETKQRSLTYDRKNPIGVRYDFDPQVIINNSEVQELFCDNSILSVAQAYLECQPVVDVTSMWWHTSYLKTPNKEAAQFYHFDMDRIKWIKFFIYLTDVSDKNGPHCFVAGSHKKNGIPDELLKYGYARLTDEEVEKYYQKEKFIEFIGPKGTIIAEDTRGLHKGKMVEADDRLILQIQFSNSLFGANYKKSFFNDMKNEKLLSYTKKYKRMYSNYTV